jgi:cyclopropane-fatty-acyl-phospholipid synthase
VSTGSEIETSYSVDNDFFALWLDREMNYTCALFADPETSRETLEDAQRNKLIFLSRLANIGPGVESVLDIGCGWGANLAHQALVNRLPHVHGITLSSAQHRYCDARQLSSVTVTLRDYRDYEPLLRFDAAMCICMMEHIARPEDARTGRHIELYRDFFRRVHSWTRPGSYFALQAITTNVLPRRREDLDDMRHANTVIFPGGLCPRVEDLVVATNPYYEIVEMYSRRLHYKRTAECWLERLQSNRTVIEQRWGPELYADYDKYLAFCVRAFEQNFQSLHQFSLRRR